MECPICSTSISSEQINQHLDQNHFNSSFTASKSQPTLNSFEIPLDSALSTESKPGSESLPSSIAPRSTSSSTLHKKRHNHEDHPIQPSSPSHDLNPSSPFNLTSRKKPRHENPTSSLPSPSTSTLRQPLAQRVRPQSIEDFQGPPHLKSTLQTLISNGHSLILWGPSGSGKTTLARCLKNLLLGRDRHHPPHHLKYEYFELPGTEFSIADWKKIVDQSNKKYGASGHASSNKTLNFKPAHLSSPSASPIPLVFVDEVQRLNKSQQDLFLPHLESGRVVMIFATTENPSFRLTIPLLSRCRLIQLKRHTIDDLKAIVKRAIEIERLPHQESVDSDLIESICLLADGDARVALSNLDLIIKSKIQDPLIDNQTIKEQILGKKCLLYDRNGDNHYDLISALHKSIRGGDANAGLYWLARMLEGGEDPLYVARRLIRMASEDIGLANPAALNQAVCAYQGTQLIGMPECDCILAQVVVMLAESPKSVRAYKAYNRAKSFVNQHPAYPVPIHLRNAPTKMMKELGYGAEYKYEPDYAHPIYQEFLPSQIIGSSSQSSGSTSQDSPSSGPPFLMPTTSWDLPKRVIENTLIKDEEDPGGEDDQVISDEVNDSVRNGRGHENLPRDDRKIESEKDGMIVRLKDGRMIHFGLLKEWKDKRNGGQSWIDRGQL